MAPVAIGGGVRVKVSGGGPRAAGGRHPGRARVDRPDLPLEPVTGEELVERAALLLRDRDAAAAEGAALV